MNDIKIIDVTPAQLGAPIFKAITSSGRPGFAIKVTYKLVDGREYPGQVAYQRKKDVLPGLDRAKRAAAAGAMSACFSEAGEFWGTSQRWQIGGGGLVPNPSNP